MAGLNSRGLRPALLALCLALAAAACGGDAEMKDFDGDANAPESADLKVGVKPEPDAEVAVLEMANADAYGKIVIELYPNIAPQMVERFKTLAREGFYNGTTFHRIEPPTADRPGGVIQGGDPNSKDDDPLNDGQGDSAYPDLPLEPSDLPYELGTVGAADAGPGTANCQFFISLGRNVTWDRRYTVFGKVIKGLDNVTVIAGTPTRGGTSTPVEKVVIKSVTLQPRSSYAAQ